MCIFFWILTKILPEDFGISYNFKNHIRDGKKFQYGFLQIANEQRNFLNPYPDGFLFDFYVYVSENETSFQSESELVWMQKNVTYGPDSALLELQTRIPVSKVGA